MKFLIIITSFFVLSCNNKNVENNNMGIFDRFLGKKESIENNNNTRSFNQQIEKTGEMLDETIYWNIIDLSLKKTKSQEEQEQFLIKEIEKLEINQIIGFRLRTDKLLYDTYNSEMWCAGYIMNGGCSDDGFEYFRNWIISRGKDVYYEAKKNPDSLISQFNENDEFYDFESFWYVALTAFENKTGKDLYDFISDDFQYSESKYPNFEFNWEEDKPETMKVICPKLFEKMWD